MIHPNDFTHELRNAEIEQWLDGYISSAYIMSVTDNLITGMIRE